MSNDARDKYIRRTYELVEGCTISDLAEIFDLDESEISSIISDDPRRNQQRDRF